MKLRVGLTLQILLVALILLFVLYRLQSEPVRVDWKQPVVFRIYPINADQTKQTKQYLSELSIDRFEDIDRFFVREAKNYRLPLKYPVKLELHPVVEDLPPEVPEEASIIEATWWGLKMRLWVAFNDQFDADPNTLRIFMNFSAPQSPEAGRHSLGLQKGRIGLVNGYASAQLQGVNNFVAVHEALHTLGAIDYYDPKTAEPIWPEGYADPVQFPLYPQSRAEVMGGRIQLTPGWAVLPPSLEYVRIGPATAHEIGWLEAVVNAEEENVGLNLD